MSDPNQTGKLARVRLSLTMEGWIYLIILSFVSVCAVLRNVNLLIVFTGVMIGPLFLSWRLGRGVIRSLIVKRILQNRIHVGQIVNIQWQLTNRGELPAWYVRIEDKITNQNEIDSDQKPARLERSRIGNSNLVFDYVPGGSSKFMSYRALFTTRGQYEIGPAKVGSMFPMGLVANWFKIDRRETVFVAPRIGQLIPDWEQRIASMAFGSQSVKRRRGPDPDEFYAIRTWRSGDNRRDIHWRTTAKHREPMVKQFDQKSNRDLALVLDLHESDLWPAAEDGAAPADGREACETVLSFAATILSQIGTLTRGRVGIAIAGRETMFFSSATQADFTPSVMRYLATVESGKKPDLREAISRVVQNVSPGTPVTIVSTRVICPSRSRKVCW